jgi:hypothetical protein
VASSRKDLGLDELWLNGDAQKYCGFEKTLLEGWEERARSEPPIYEGRFLVVYQLSRPDYADSKVYALLTRGGGAGGLRDAEDLATIKLSLEEFETSLARLMQTSRFAVVSQKGRDCAEKLRTLLSDTES